MINNNQNSLYGQSRLKKRVMQEVADALKNKDKNFALQTLAETSKRDRLNAVANQYFGQEKASLETQSQRQQVIHNFMLKSNSCLSSNQKSYRSLLSFKHKSTIPTQAGISKESSTAHQLIIPNNLIQNQSCNNLCAITEERISQVQTPIIQTRNNSGNLNVQTQPQDAINQHFELIEGIQVSPVSSDKSYQNKDMTIQFNIPKEPIKKLNPISRNPQPFYIQFQPLVNSVESPSTNLTSQQGNFKIETQKDDIDILQTVFEQEESKSNATPKALNGSELMNKKKLNREMTVQLELSNPPTKMKNRKIKENRYMRNTRIVKNNLADKKSARNLFDLTLSKQGLQSINEYNITDLLGEGAFGKVWKVYHTVEQKEYAMKAIQKNVIWDTEEAGRPLTLKAEHKIKEIEIMLNLHNPHCIHLHEIIESPDNGTIYIVMHLYPKGTLQNKIDQANLTVNDWPEEPAHETYRQVISLYQVRQWTKQLMSALYTCHKKTKVVHRDIKPENLMLDRDNNLIMVDFGESTRFLDENDFLGGVKGTLLYRAPEYYLAGVPAQKEISLRLVDIWAAGASIYHIATGQLPFPAKSFAEFKKSVNTQHIDFSMFGNTPDEIGIVKLLKKMLVIEYPVENRYQIQDLLTDEWLTVNGTDPVDLYTADSPSKIINNTSEPSSPFERSNSGHELDLTMVLKNLQLQRQRKSSIDTPVDSQNNNSTLKLQSYKKTNQELENNRFSIDKLNMQQDFKIVTTIEEKDYINDSLGVRPQISSDFKKFSLQLKKMKTDTKQEINQSPLIRFEIPQSIINEQKDQNNDSDDTFQRVESILE